MAQVESRIAEIRAAGSELAFIAAEKRDGVWKPGQFLEKHPVSSVFLLDEDRTVTKAYGLYHALGTDAIRIAHPATLVLCRGEKGRASSLRYIYRGDNQLDRAPLDEVLGVLQEIGK
jgi:peroxiredoxin